jgi:hypothetical protein
VGILVYHSGELSRALEPIHYSIGVAGPGRRGVSRGIHFFVTFEKQARSSLLDNSYQILTIRGQKASIKQFAMVGSAVFR